VDHARIGWYPLGAAELFVELIGSVLESFCLSFEMKQPGRLTEPACTEKWFYFRPAHFKVK
jgi:hypothetical protein